MISQDPRILTVSKSCGHVTELVSALAGHGWTTQCVSTCRDALAYLDQHATHLVLCESKLPDGSWKTLLDALLTMRNAPLLAVYCSQGDDALLMDVLKLDGYQTVVRPLDFNELGNALAAAALGAGRHSLN